MWRSLVLLLLLRLVYAAAAAAAAAGAVCLCLDCMARLTRLMSRSTRAVSRPSFKATARSRRDRSSDNTIQSTAQHRMATEHKDEAEQTKRIK